MKKTLLGIGDSPFQPDPQAPKKKAKVKANANANAKMKVRRATRTSWAGGVLGIGLVAWLASFPTWADAGWMREIDEMACYLVFAMMWNLLAGYGGMVSIGQQAFLGLGGYALLGVGNFFGINPFFAGAVVAVVAVVIVFPGSLGGVLVEGGCFFLGP